MFKKVTALFISFIVTVSSFVSVSAVGLEDIYQIGDVDGDGNLTIVDATSVQKYLAGLIQLDENRLMKADANYDGTVNIADATMIQKRVAGLYSPLTGKRGVDISSLNGSVDIRLAKDAGYDFVMLRCGFGNNDTSQDDSQFENNVRQCEELGVPWGVYLYSYALNLKEAESEADHILRLLKGKKPTLPVVFDMEDGDGYKRRYGMPSNEMLVAICKLFLGKISEAGYYGMLYTNLDWITTKLNDSTLTDSYDIWLAQWNTECEYSGKTLGMWQYGGEVNYIDGNTIDGIGLIDKNFVYKDYPLIIQNGRYNGW